MRWKWAIFKVRLGLVGQWPEMSCRTGGWGRKGGEGSAGQAVNLPYVNTIWHSSTPTSNHNKHCLAKRWHSLPLWRIHLKMTHCFRRWHKIKSETTSLQHFWRIFGIFTSVESWLPSRNFWWGCVLITDASTEASNTWKKISSKCFHCCKHKSQCTFQTSPNIFSVTTKFTRVVRIT